MFSTSFRASLGWFAHEPEWYDVKHVNFAQSEAQSVSIFLHYLSSDRGNGLQFDAKTRGRENGISVVNSVSFLYSVYDAPFTYFPSFWYCMSFATF